MRAHAVGQWLRRVRRPLPQKHASYDLVAGSGLFDAAWYRTCHHDVAASGEDPLEHYLRQGFLGTCDPNPFFSTRFYLERYGQVIGAQRNPLVDFIEDGASERRDPSIYFDCDWYLNMYRDVAGARFNPLQHYIRYGETEGRWPNASFSPRFYRARHLSGEPATTSPLEHYIRKGRHQGLETKEDPATRYETMTRVHDQNLCAELPEIEDHIRGLTAPPHFFVYGEYGCTAETLNLRAQIYPFWSVCDDKDELLSLAGKRGQSPWFALWVSPEDVFHRAMLYRFACEYESNADVEVIYADDDALTDEGRRIDPFYKPDWSPDYLGSCNYIGGTACVGGAVAAPILKAAESQYDFLLRATESAKQISHLPVVLGHRTRPLTGIRSPIEQQSDMRALAKALEREGRQGVVTQACPGLACYHVAPSPSSGLPVTIIIPTAGKDVMLKGCSVDLVTALVSQILRKPAYQDMEFIAVINDDMTDEKRSTLHKMRVRTIVYRHDQVNIAKKINLGASIASRDYLLILNDDIEPLSFDWVEQMLALFDRPHVGVVGAKLLYGDEKVQHVGVVLNSGNPDHPRTRYPRDDKGYFFSSLASRNYLAVTGAVMLTRRSLFEAVGGFTPDLAISYNDIDYCLKLRELGKVAVYCPKAELLHYESLSRDRILDMSEMHYFHKRWAHIPRDPFYNEEFLTMAPPTFEACDNKRLIG